MRTNKCDRCSKEGDLLYFSTIEYNGYVVYCVECAKKMGYLMRKILYVEYEVYENFKRRQEKSNLTESEFLEWILEQV